VNGLKRRVKGLGEGTARGVTDRNFVGYRRNGTQKGRMPNF